MASRETPDTEALIDAELDLKMAQLSITLCDLEDVEDEIRELIHAVARAAYMRGSYDALRDGGKFYRRIERMDRG